MSEYNQTLGNKISSLRKEHSMTQEQMASALSVTFQAVSKWENGLSCPDIALIPKIADLFQITLDELFGRETPTPAPAASPLPWEDDGALRAVLFIGHRFVKDGEMSDEKSRITFEYDGPALAVESDFSVRCGDVQGPVSAGGSVECRNVAGSVSAGGNVALDRADGNVSAGGKIIYTAGDDVRIEIESALNSAKSSIKSGLSSLGSALSGIFTRDDDEKDHADDLHIHVDVSDEKPASGPISSLPWEDDDNLRAVLFRGQKLMDRAALTGSRATLSFSGRVNNIESAFDVDCGEVRGSVTAGGDVDCSNVGGSVTASGDVDCGSVGGNATAAGDMDCGSVGGNASAGGDLDCGDVGGNASAGGNLSCGDVTGDATAMGDMDCGDVGGSVRAEGDVECGDVNGRIL